LGLLQAFLLFLKLALKILCNLSEFIYKIKNGLKLMLDVLRKKDEETKDGWSGRTLEYIKKEK
jgi:hypothetical protein